MLRSFRRWLKSSTPLTRRPRGYRPRLMSLESREVPATFTVTNLNNSGAGSLRQAILDANANGTGIDTIAFSVGAGTIILTSEIAITGSVLIDGPAALNVTVSGNKTNRIFNIENAGAALTVTINDLTLVNGSAATDGGAIRNAGETLTIDNSTLSSSTSSFGGAIFTTGPLSISNSDVTGSSAANGGGIAVYQGSVSVTTSTISKNSSSGLGGGIYLFSNGTHTIDQTYFDSNRAADGGHVGSAIFGGSLTISQSVLFQGSATNRGGGLSHFSIGPASGGSLTVVSTEISGCVAGQGGGVYLSSPVTSMTFRNCTVSTNFAQDGAGFRLLNCNTQLVLQNTTVTNNSASVRGGGINRFGGTGTISIESTILSGNFNGSTINLSPDVENNGTTFARKNSAVGSNLGLTADSNLGGNLPFQPHANLKLGPLTSNGDSINSLSMFTHRPANDSPLINAGTNPASLATDARGISRVWGTAVDIGSMEVPITTHVLNTNNTGTGSLRQAVFDANTDSNPGASTTSTITFDPTVFAAAQTITLTSEIAISDSVIITGPGADSLTISGALKNRLFNIDRFGLVIDVALDKMTMTQGFASGSGGAILNNDENLFITNSRLTNNSVTGSGAAIYSTSGPLTITNSAITNNTSSGLVVGSGAIRAQGGLVMTGSTVSGNTGASGAGIFVRNSCTILGSTIANNSSQFQGGGILFETGSAAVVIRNSTITGNSASIGAGVYLGGPSYAFNGSLAAQNSTIVGNVASFNGGGLHLRTGSTGAINLESTIVSGNLAPSKVDIESSQSVTAKNSAVGDSIGFTLTDLGGNLPFQPHANLKLGALANNGGLTQTMLPAVDSPLIDAGSNPAAVTTDQRGQGRSAGQTDIGAVELINFVVFNTKDSGFGSLRQTIVHANSIVGVNTITFDPTAFASAQTITLTTGQLSISSPLTISGPTAARVTLDAMGASRIISTSTAASLTQIAISNLTFVNGSGSNGGAIFQGDESVSLSDCEFLNNTATSYGGAIQISGNGRLNVSRSSFSGNRASSGGAIATVFAESEVLVSNSTFANNSASTHGGAIYAYTDIAFATTDVDIFNSTLSNNTATFGGGVYTETSLFAGNNDLVIRSSIVSGNIGTTANADIYASQTITVTHSAIGDGTGFSLSGGSGSNLAFGQNLLLGPLQYNGGPTKTMLPASGSPVFDAGSNSSGLTTDQRGNMRVIGSQIDIGAAEAASLIVLNSNDTGFGSLRQTVEHANQNPGADTITFDPTAFATASTITLTSEIAVTDSTAIQGPGADKAIVSGNNLTRIFNVDGPGNLTVDFSGLTLANGSAASNGGAVRVGNEFVTFDRVVIRDSKSAASGGGVGFLGSGGKLTVIDSEVSGNSATGDGGGLYVYGTSAVLVRGSTLSANSSGNRGGAFSGFSWSSASSFLLQNATVTNNTAVNAGGAFRVQGGTAALNVVSSVVAGNSGPVGSPDIAAGVVNFTNSLLGSAAGHTLGTNLDNLTTGTPAKLGPLANNGGPSRTHLPATDSPLRDAGSNPNSTTTDQRGFARTWNAHIDIGAVELDPVFVVRNVSDSGKDSLRQQIQDANDFAGTDTITFDTVTFGTPQTIKLASVLSIAAPVVITGPGATLVTVSGEDVTRVFDSSPATGAIGVSKLTIANARSTTGSAAAFHAGNESVTLTEVVIRNNTASAGGGAGVGSGAAATITLVNSTLTANTGTNSGGAVSIDPNGSLIVLNSTISGNTATSSQGGAIRFAGAVGPAGFTIRNSTLSGNSATSGGAIGLTNAFTGILTIDNSTIVDNTTAGNGGGINRGAGTPTINLTSSIVANNEAGGSANNINVSVGTVNAIRSLLGGAGFIANFVPDTTTNDLLGLDPVLGPLANNGGSTLTHMPLAGSPLFDVGSNPAGLTTDQRGNGRVIGSQIDIGATEGVSLVVTNTDDSGYGSLRQTMQHANSNPGPDTITFDPVVFADPETINLTTTGLSLTQATTITGPAAGVTINNTVAGNIVLDIQTAPTGAGITLSRLALTGGNNTAGGLDGRGGAIRGSNEALTLIDCAIFGNSASGNGGGVALQGGGSLTLLNSSVTGNTAFLDGGGVSVYSSSLVVTNTTIAGNTAKNGGGMLITNFTSPTINNATIVGNTATSQGGGIHVASGASTITISHSIVANNNSTGTGPDLSAFGKINVVASAIGSSAGVTNFSPDATTTALLGKNFLLAPLEDYGSLTLTVAILPGSPLIDAGSSTITTDQRGQSRVGASDIGAFESQGFKVAVSNGSSQTTYISTAFADPLVVEVSANNALEPVEGGIVTFAAPMAGASAILSASTATLDFFGEASVTATANATQGAYTVTATTAPGATADFALINGEPGSLVVNLATDTSDPLDNKTSLREAIAFANYKAGADTIVFDASVFLSAVTITLNGSAIDITDTLTIPGTSPSLLTVNGDGKSGVFHVEFDPAESLTLSNFTITGGKQHAGGGISQNEGQLTLKNMALVGNTAEQDGGAIYFDQADVVIESSTFTGNNANYGAAIYIATSSVLLLNSTFAQNTANNEGGAIFSIGLNGITVRHSTLTSNSATDNGGALFSLSDATITLNNSIVSGNTSGNGPDIWSDSTIDASNSAIGNSGGFTLGVNSGNLPFGTNLLLAPLGSYGGLTQTVALLPGSPAINAGSSTITTDQRGQSRVGAPDIGAFESQGFTIGALSGSGQSTKINTAFANPLVATVTPTNPVEPVNGGVVTFAAPGAGASATLGATTVTITAGQASTSATANGDVGSYTVDATANGATSTSFNLTNDAAATPAKITGLVIGDGTAQRSMVNQIKITFDSPVSFVGSPADAFTLTRQKDAASVTLAAAVLGNEVTLTFTGGAIDDKSLADGRYTLTALAGQFAGGGLDGDGNGTGGDNYTLVGDPTNGLFRLFGDADGSGQVNPTDFLAFRLAFLSTNPAFDFNGDGTVGPGDFLAFRLRFLSSV